MAVSKEDRSVGAARGTLTDNSAAITTGGAAQQGLAANPARAYWILQNLSAGDLWYSFTGSAAVNGAGSFKLTAGGTAVADPLFISTQALSIVGALAGQAFTLQEG